MAGAMKFCVECDGEMVTGRYTIGCHKCAERRLHHLRRGWIVGSVQAGSSGTGVTYARILGLDRVASELHLS